MISLICGIFKKKRKKPKPKTTDKQKKKKLTDIENR